MLHPGGHMDLAWRAFRAVSAAMMVVLAGPVGASTYQWLQEGLQEETELTHCRSTMQELSFMVRHLPARAAIARRPVQLLLDADRGMVQVAAVYEGRPQPYDAVLRTMWLPKGLQVLEAPEQITVAPNEMLASTLFLLAAPSHNTVFRLTLRDGIVRLDEQPLL